ncbi:ADO family protein [Megaselia abdita]
MSQLFTKIVKEALKTFDRSNLAAFTSNLANLKELTNDLSIEDIGINFQLLKEQISRTCDENDCPTSPCTYVHIFQNDFLSLSVFILKKDYQMPLHDHPMMHGLLKPLCGQLLIQSFTREYENDTVPVYNPNDLDDIPVIVEKPMIVNEKSESIILTPMERNFHEIKALGEVGAFFDILSPPYESELPEYGTRACTFFKKKSLVYPGKMFLEIIPAPSSYHCNQGEYARPQFLVDLDRQHSGRL